MNIDEEIEQKLNTEIAFKKFQLSQLEFKKKELKQELKALNKTLKEFKKNNMIII